MQKLTKRQLEIALLAISGRPMKQIAKTLGVSYDTVNHTLEDIRHKLAAPDKSAIPRRLVELGYVKPADLPMPIERQSIDGLQLTRKVV